MGNPEKHAYASYPRFAGGAKLECKHSSLAYALRAKNSRSQILLVSCLLLYLFHCKLLAGNSLYTTKGYGQNTVHSLRTQICTGKETIYEKDIKSLSYVAVFPDEILTCYITLYSVQCFIGFDCTELIFFLGGSSFVM